MFFVVEIQPGSRWTDKQTHIQRSVINRLTFTLKKTCIDLCFKLVNYSIIYTPKLGVK